MEKRITTMSVRVDVLSRLRSFKIHRNESDSECLSRVLLLAEREPSLVPLKLGGVD